MFELADFDKLKIGAERDKIVENFKSRATIEKNLKKNRNKICSNKTLKKLSVEISITYKFEKRSAKKVEMSCKQNHTQFPNLRHANSHCGSFLQFCLLPNTVHILSELRAQVLEISVL